MSNEHKEPVDLSGLPEGTRKFINELREGHKAARLRTKELEAERDALKEKVATLESKVPSPEPPTPKPVSAMSKNEYRQHRSSALQQLRRSELVSRDKRSATPATPDAQSANIKDMTREQYAAYKAGLTRRRLGG